ncbi:MAG: NAD(P)-dependent oxidoreductase [Planctomycetota bacterium]
MKFDIVTGYTGFVGKALVLRLIKLNRSKKLILVGRNRPDFLDENTEYHNKWQYIEFDYTKLPTAKFPVNNIDTVYHCGGISSISARWIDLLNTNVNGTVNFLSWIIAAAKIERVIFISSALACGYDTSSNGSLCRLNQETPSNPNTPYGRSKYETELKIKALAIKHGFKLVIVRPSYIYGTGMRQNSGFSKFIHMVKNQSIGARMNYPGSLSFTHIDNLITLLIHVSRDESTVDEIFFADSKPILYTELFKILGEILGIEIKSIKLPIILYKSISWSLIHLYKIPYVKKKVPFHLLPLIKENIGCIDFDEINVEYKSCINISLEDGLKKTIH